MGAEIIVMGTSMGGLDALETVLSGLQESLPVPVVIVQHRGRNSGDELAELLQRYTAKSVIEAEDRELLNPANVYVAPADYHLIVEHGYLSLSLEAPVKFARPSVDLLFETASYSYRSGVIAVVLTGANTDGAAGAMFVKRSGGKVLVQEPGDCLSSSMPLAAIKAVDVDHVVKLGRMAEILNLCCDGGAG